MTASGVTSIHVRPGTGGLWRVYVDQFAEAASEHGTASDAERFALALAATHTDSEIVVHDAYHRCRIARARGVPTSPSWTAH